MRRSFGVQADYVQPKESMTNLKRSISIAILSMVLVLIVHAQPPRSGNQERHVAAVLERLERSSNKFRQSLNAALIQIRVDQTRPQNDINTFEPSLANAIRLLKGEQSRRIAVAVDIEKLLQKATAVNAFMSNNQLNRQVQKDWVAIRSDLNVLAGIYGLTWQWNRLAAPIESNGSLSMSDTELDQLIKRIELGEDAFRSSLTDAFGLSRYDQTISEAKMNDNLRFLGHDTNQLRIQFDDKKAVAGSVERVLARATPIDVYVRSTRLTDQAQNDWSSLRNDFNLLAAAYDLTVSWPTASASTEHSPKP
jgi:hypothetical protein